MSHTPGQSLGPASAQITPRVQAAAPQHALCPQVCVSSCPEIAWTVEVNQLSQKVGEVFNTANRNFCLPGVPWDMVRAASSVKAVVKEESHGWGGRSWVGDYGGGGGSLLHPALCLRVCMSSPTPSR